MRLLRHRTADAADRAAEGRWQDGAGGDDGSLSLVNIAFLLLAFFVMAAAIRTADPFQVAPPAGAAPPLAESEGPELLVAADGRMALDGLPVASGRELEAALAALPASPAVLRLRVDGGADAGGLMRLLDRLRAAGVGEVVLVTRTVDQSQDR